MSKFFYLSVRVCKPESPSPQEFLIMILIHFLIRGEFKCIKP